MSDTIRMLWLSPARTRILFYGLAALLGMAAASLIFVVPPMYLLFLVGALIFVYLLLVRIEAAIVVALLLQTTLYQFNYLGQGTPFHPNGFIGIAIIAGALFYFAFNRVEISAFRKAGWFMVFFVLCVISTLTVPPQYSMDSLTVTLRLATSLSIFTVLLFRLNSITATKWVLGAVIAAQLPSTISRLLIRAGSTGLSFTSGTLRLGDSGLGITLAVTLTLCLVFLLSAKSGRLRALWGTLTVLFAVALFFSFGRSAWLSFLVVLLMIGIARHKWLLIITPVALIAAILIVPGITERFWDISLTDVTGGSSTLAGRVQTWDSAMAVFATHPVFGVGIGAGASTVGDYFNERSGMIHNDYVSLLLETGLVGLGLFLLWQVQWLRSLFRVYRESLHPYDKTLALGVLGVLVLSLVARFTDNIILDTYDMYPLCALAATVMALPRIRAAMETNRG